MTSTVTRANLYADTDWDREMEHEGFAVASRSVAGGLSLLGATLYEIPAGKSNLPYHQHHAMDEMIIVVAGRPTVRTPDGDQELAQGDVYPCPAGPAGAHQIRNRTDEAVRVLVVSNMPQADVVEYPDSGKVAAGVGAWGTPECRAWRLDGAAERGYFDDEQP